MPDNMPHNKPHKFRTTMRTKSSSRPASKLISNNGQSVPPSQGALIAARSALLKATTSDPRSPLVFDRIDRSNGLLQDSPETQVLDRPYPRLPSLRHLSRDDQRARVGDSDRPLKTSKPSRLWKSHVKMTAEERLAEDEAEELVSEMNEAMGVGDLELVDLLSKQLDEISNGIFKVGAEKGAEQNVNVDDLKPERKVSAVQAARQKVDDLKPARRISNSVLGFVKKLRRVAEEDEEED